MSLSYKTPSYFAGFSCLGGDCDDTCCRDWEVKLDRQHFDLLKIAMSKEKNEKSIFEQYIHINENSITSDYDFAFIRMGVNGYCTMLDDKGLCSIHDKHGVTALGNVCTMFPRVISRCADTIELSGALSCPEVVRNCIDNPTPLKLKRFKTADLPRGKNYPIQRELSSIDGDFYDEKFPLVREHLMNIMANEEYELESRLYLMANMTDKLSGFYYKGCVKPSEGQLESMLTAFSKSDMAVKLSHVIKDYDADSQISMVVAHSILSIKLEQSNTENISLMYEKIILKYSVLNENISEVLAERLHNIKNNLDEASSDYLDKAITRYILNCLYREWFVSMPDSFTYIQMLLIRTSILRILIYLYIGDEELELHQLKQKIVYVMYNFARNIDQNLEFLKLIYNALSEQGMMNFDFSPSFIRI